MKVSSIMSVTILLLIVSTIIHVDGCQSCLAAPLHHSIKKQRAQLHHHMISNSASSPGALLSKELFSRSILKSNGGVIVATLRGMTRSIKRHPAAKPMMVLGAGVILSQRAFQGYPSIPLLRSANDEELDKLTDEDSDAGAEEDEDSQPMTAAMVGTIGIYKNYISPLLPPACRFLPTCSQCK